MPATVALGQRPASSSAYDRARDLILRFEKTIKVAAPEELISTKAKLLLLGMIADEIGKSSDAALSARAVLRGSMVTLQTAKERIDHTLVEISDELSYGHADRVGSFDHISVPVAGVMRALGDRPTDRAIDDVANAMRRGPVEQADDRPDAGDEELRKTTTAVEILDDRIALGIRSETERSVPRQAAE